MYAAGFGVNCNILLFFLGKGDIIEDTANAWLHWMLDIAIAAGTTDELKARDPIQWVRLLIFQRPEGTPLWPLTIQIKNFQKKCNHNNDLLTIGVKGPIKILWR